MQDVSPPISPLDKHPGLGRSLTIRLLLISFILILLIKIFLAVSLDLYSDEIFYWQASTNPAIAYSDLPFVTALLIGLGSSLDPGNTLAARLLFLIMGSSLPLLVYWISRPLSNQQQALESSLLMLCLPLAGFLGLLAVPDVPLLFFGLLSIGSFERALRLNSFKFWFATGLFVGLGLSTHYRFFLYPAAAILFLLLFKPERRQWKNPRLWASMAIACLGLVPILWFNLSNQLSSASFYFVNRHPWEFQASGLLHVFKQAGLVTPLLYLLFAYTVYRLWLRARQGERGPALILSFSLLNLLVYLVLAPWTDATSTSIHWPLSGYFPLLIFAPWSLRVAYQHIADSWSTKAARIILIITTILGFTGTLIALFGVGSQAFQMPLQQFIGPGVLSNKMAGWKEFSSYTEELIAREFPNEKPLLVSDNYYTLAQIEFAQLSDNALTLDRDKAVRDGRIAQYEIWSKEESGMAAQIGNPVLFITEDSTLSVIDKTEVMERLCHHVGQLMQADVLSLYNGDKKFSYYKADAVIDSSNMQSYQSFPCPYPARGWIDQPSDGDSLSGEFSISGWAFNEDIGVKEVFLLIDGVRYSSMTYGGHRPDVMEAMSVRSDPGRPALGFNYNLDTTQFSNGEFELAIEIVNQKDISLLYGERTIEIAN